jgi:(4S)-4-hydroxy-5-phosphonooxypentane-2,3-dione isomerase
MWPVSDAYVVVVEFALHPGMRAAFRPVMDANARASAAEPGCRRFDVVEPSEDADRILLYEIYDDRAAFEAHLATPHFAIFNRESSPMIAERRVVFGALVCEGARD